MLVILYITSILAGWFTLAFVKHDGFKKAIISFTVAVLAGIAFCTPIINKTLNNLSKPDLISVFGVVSLIASQFAFLLNDVSTLFSYQVASFITSALICFFCSTFYYSDYLTSCNQEHVYTEIVPIVTTVDGTKSGENIYGEGFVIGLIVKDNPNIRLYQYYFKTDDGTIETEEIFANRTAITFNEHKDFAPYIEITYWVDCMGFRSESQVHVFRGAYKTYHLYIPEASIQTNITPTS